MSLKSSKNRDEDLKNIYTRPTYIIWAKMLKIFIPINNLENSYKSSYHRILKCLEKQSLFCLHCFVNTSDCISSIQNPFSILCNCLEKSLSFVLEHWEVSYFVFEQHVIWYYIFVKLSLEVQGGQDYFRFVEGTCIIACGLSFSTLLLSIRCIKTLNSSQTLNSIRLWSWEQFL